MPRPGGASTLSTMPPHVSVMFDEVMEALRPRPGGYVAVDCTVNGGGHTEGLLARSAPDGRVVALDADAGALELAAERLAPFGERVQLVHRNFADLASVAEEQDLEPVDGVLMDLGLSSTQLDLSGRGFSFRFDEPLDMRFDATSGGPTAADILNKGDEEDIAHYLHEYGEERASRRLARTFVQLRQTAPFRRTGDVVAAVTRVLGPPRGRIHPATRTFQALRIAVNDELGALERALDAGVGLLRPGGRLVVISFHSLEDRIVKWRFRAWAGDDPGPQMVKILTKRPLTPTDEETQRNPRARSAKVRVAERVASPWS